MYSYTGTRTWACRAHFVDEVDGRAKLAEVTKIKKREEMRVCNGAKSRVVYTCVYKVRGSVPLHEAAAWLRDGCGQLAAAAKGATGYSHDSSESELSALRRQLGSRS